MSITSYGPSTLPKEGNKLLARFQEKKTNDVSDIEGARSQSKYKHYFTDKPAFLPSDVEGSTSKPLTHSRNTRDNTLYIDDIEGTRSFTDLICLSVCSIIIGNFSQICNKGSDDEDQQTYQSPRARI